MKITLRLLAFCFLCSCVSKQKVTEPVAAPALPPLPAVPLKVDMFELKRNLGLERDLHELGFAEKDYDGCRMSLPGDEKLCGPRYFSMVNFRLVCRDTVGTTSRVPTSLQPLRGKMQWRLNGKRGVIRTDAEGYGQVQMVSRQSSRAQQFILVIGKKFLGVEAGEVSQIVLPRNWCPR